MNPFGVSVDPATESEFFNAARHTTFLLVEGNVDERFWRRWIEPRRCQIRAMGGRDKVVAELELNRREGRPGFVAVIDADFDRIDGVLRADPDIVYTDENDLEGMLVRSPALETVLHILGSAGKCAAFEEQHKSIRDALVDNARIIGKLRWLSKRDKLNLTFRKQKDSEFQYLRYKEFCDPKEWSVEPKKLVIHVCNFSMRHELKVDELLSRMRVLPDVDPWQLCVGHDLIGLLVIGLRQVLGNATKDESTIQDSLLLAYEEVYLLETSMYRALRAWEAKDARFRVLRRKKPDAD